MSFLQRILPRVSVLSAVYRDAGTYRLNRYLCKLPVGDASLELEEENISLEEKKKEIGQYPLLLLISGYGVISKDTGETSGIVGQVTSDPEHFRWTFSEEERKIAFVRHTQLEGLIQALEEASLTPVEIVCMELPAEEVSMAISGRAAAFAAHNITLGKVFRPAASSSSLALLVFKKLRLPVLGIILALLLGNFVIGNNLRESFQTQHARLQALQAERQRGGEQEEQNRQMLARMGSTLPWRYALLCDRVATDMPQGITLTRLAVQPLQKALENNTPPLLSERMVIIQGEAPSSDEIASYVAALGREPFGKGLKLSSVERNRESETLLFRIDLSL